MIDSICLESPSIDDNVASLIEDVCERRLCMLPGGVIKYEFVSCDLPNSSDHRISLKVLRNKWQRDNKNGVMINETVINGVIAKTEKIYFINKQISCGTYLKIECSVHKQMLGHNCFGGSSDFQGCIKWLITHITTLINSILTDNKIDGKIVLPDYLQWQVRRIDVAEIFNLGSSKICYEWFRIMQSVEYPRREKKSSKHGLTGLYFPGSKSTLKFYHKGTEFRKHDYKRVRDYLGLNEAENILTLANCIIRVELEIHPRWLKEMYGGNLPKVFEIDNETLKQLHDDEVRKVLKMVKEGVKVIRRASDVESYLYNTFESKLAGTLLGTWYRLSANGEKKTSENMKESTLRRHKKLLRDNGITWNGTDVVIDSSIVPLDFVPLRTDRHYFGNVLKEIQEMIDNVA